MHTLKSLLTTILVTASRCQRYPWSVCSQQCTCNVITYNDYNAVYFSLYWYENYIHIERCSRPVLTVYQITLMRPYALIFFTRI